MIYSATFSNGKTVSVKTKRSPAFCVAYISDLGASHLSWAGDRSKAETVANQKRKSASTPGTIVCGCVVEIVPAVAA